MVLIGLFGMGTLIPGIFRSIRYISFVVPLAPSDMIFDIEFSR